MSRYAAVLLALGLVLAGCGEAKPSQAPAVSINGQRVNVELAQTVAERSRGLSGRASLKPNTGMLFVFDEPTMPNFWMKDMRFPLDLIWIADQTVVGITRNVPLPTSTVLLHYTPDQPVSHVLEVNAGWTTSHGVKTGDLVEFFFLTTVEKTD